MGELIGVFLWYLRIAWARAAGDSDGKAATIRRKATPILSGQGPPFAIRAKGEGPMPAERLSMRKVREVLRLKPQPDWNHVHAELRRRGVTLALLWQEYRAGAADGYGYSRFCDLYGE